VGEGLIVAVREGCGRLICVVISDQSQDGDVVLAVCPTLTDEDLNELFGASWPGHGLTSFAPVLARSLGWITARRGSRLVGFVNVAGDGGAHAFILDTTVHPDERRQGLGVRLVRAATDEARNCGARWLHVDYEPHLEPFYAQCGFRPTAAGLMRL
jgi:GNAT superfamily N-acetyltransferase